MKRNTSIINKNGFSLLEITVVLIIVSILLSAVIPVLSRSYLEKAANKTALDISTIQEASRKFYIDNNQWPTATITDTTPLAVLQDPANGYLPPASVWNAINPFGTSAATPSNYSYIIQPPTSSSLTVCANVPTAAQNIIINSLPSSYVDTSGDATNGDVCSSVSVPGASSVLPTGSIISYAALVTSVNPAPQGFLLCDGTSYYISDYPALGHLLGGIYGGDGTTTFAVPDLRDRTIVEADTPVGGNYSNIITQFATTSGDPTKIIGRTFGESEHTLQDAEIPAFTLTFPMWKGNGEGGAVRYSSSYSASYVGNLYQSYYGNASGNANPHNVVQPSMAMEYIIKF
jgi:prepilin-type N-terminal cleavage/methylation domain-containing protein